MILQRALLAQLRLHMLVNANELVGLRDKFTIRFAASAARARAAYRARLILIINLTAIFAVEFVR